MNMNMDESNKKNEQIIRILRPINYLIIALRTFLCTFIIYYFLLKDLSINKWWLIADRQDAYFVNKGVFQKSRVLV